MNVWKTARLLAFTFFALALLLAAALYPAISPPVPSDPFGWDPSMTVVPEADPFFRLQREYASAKDKCFKRDFDTLIDLITRQIAPTTWDEVGGPGSVSGFDTNLHLVVTSVQEVHEPDSAPPAAIRRHTH